MDIQYKHIYSYTVWKVSKYGVFSGPHFPVYALNAEISDPK